MKNEKEIEAKGETGFTLDMGSMKKKIEMPNLPKPLTLDEKKFLLAVERGDTANVRRMVQKAHRKHAININCVDPLGRGAMSLAIDQENLEMLELLVILGLDTKDSLLHAINVGFVEAVELLLEHEELIHRDGQPYSWEGVDWNTATFTRDITPLVLAAHRNNYEILKILLDRGATLPMPHDIKCGCNVCLKESQEDTLRHSQSRVNEYKALSSPSLMALSSNDPILTAFELSWDLRNLAFAEQESKAQYMELRRQCQQFAVDLLAQSRSSQELAIILNHDPENPPYEDGEHMKLARLELAIQYKQKRFVAHPNVQQLLAAIWYEGLPGFRRKPLVKKLLDIVTVALLFPVYCMLYMIFPNTHTGKLMRKPFMKFLIHASSYLFFLLLLILVSQRAEVLVVQLLGTESMRANLEEQLAIQRGNLPSLLEFIVTIYVFGFIWEETVEIWREGIQKYLKNMWNFIDFTRNSLYVAVIMLRLVAYIQQSNEIAEDPATAYIPRELWNDYDPQLIAEGLLAAANVFSALKLVHLFSINPHLGPLQISLGRMVIDIVKFFFIYSLVLFAFACGLNQLLWYFAEQERRKCYSLPGGMPDWDNRGDSCSKWRSFGNLFESTQSLFWASFGGIGVDHFQLAGIKSYTRFWGLLMFGSYSVINVIVLLNLLIAMMSNSYAIIDEHSDTEWKFARTKLWMSYFEESATLPPPFNIFPTPKLLFKIFGLRKKDKVRRMSTKRKEKKERERDYRYTAVMRSLVWRYVSGMQRAQDEAPVTEDDVNEIKGEISSMKCELLNVLEKNGMDVSLADRKEKTVLGKKMKVWERRLMKDFHLAPVAGEEDMDLLMTEPPPDEDPLSKFRRLAKLAVLNSTQQKWGQLVRGVCQASQIGHCNNKESFKNQQNLQKAMVEARKLVARSPRPESRTSSPSPIKLPETTGHTLMELLNDISQETGPVSPGNKRSPFGGGGGGGLLLSVQSDRTSQIGAGGLRARSVSPALRSRDVSPDVTNISAGNDKNGKKSASPRKQVTLSPRPIPQTCITMDDDTLTVKTEENECSQQGNARNTLTSPPRVSGASLSAPAAPQRSPMKMPPITPTPSDQAPTRPSSPDRFQEKLQSPEQPSPKKETSSIAVSSPIPEDPNLMIRTPSPSITATEPPALPVRSVKALTSPITSPTAPDTPAVSPQPPPTPVRSPQKPTSSIESVPYQSRSAVTSPGELRPASRSHTPRSLSPAPSLPDTINSTNPVIKSCSSTEPLIALDSPETPRSTRMETPSPVIEQVKTIKRQPKSGWL